MRRVVRNPLADTDPYAVPFLSGSAWWDFGFGPVCRRLLVKYGVPLPTGHREQDAPSTGARAELPAHLRDLDETIRARVAAHANTDEYATAQLAQGARAAVGTDPAEVPMLPLDTFRQGRGMGR